MEKIVVFGYGSQGSAQAQNLCDSGKAPSVWVRNSSPRTGDVSKVGIPLITDPISASKEASLAALLIPDSEQGAFYYKYMEPYLPKGAAILFAHGFSIHYRQIKPRTDLDVILIAPLAQGETVRSDYIAGHGVPCITAVAQDSSGRAKVRTREYAEAIARSGPFIESTFAEEVETDLFAEQAVLCGGLPELARAAFDTLLDNGYNPDIAYFCCLKELRPIVKLLEKYGIAGSRTHISSTARYGALTRGPRIVGEGVRRELRQILGEIRSGEFARELAEDNEKRQPVLTERAEHERSHTIEKIHLRYCNQKS